MTIQPIEELLSQEFNGGDAVEFRHADISGRFTARISPFEDTRGTRRSGTDGRVHAT